MAARILNLNKARKARARRAKKADADANAVRFGRTKAQKELDEARRQKDRDRLDRHRREE